MNPNISASHSYDPIPLADSNEVLTQSNFSPGPRNELIIPKGNGDTYGIAEDIKETIATRPTLTEVKSFIAKLGDVAAINNRPPGECVPLFSEAATFLHRFQQAKISPQDPLRLAEQQFEKANKASTYLSNVLSLLAQISKEPNKVLAVFVQDISTRLKNGRTSPSVEMDFIDRAKMTFCIGTGAGLAPGDGAHDGKSEHKRDKTAEEHTSKPQKPTRLTQEDRDKIRLEKIARLKGQPIPEEVQSSASQPEPTASVQPAETPSMLEELLAKATIEQQARIDDARASSCLPLYRPLIDQLLLKKSKEMFEQLTHTTATSIVSWAMSELDCNHGDKVQFLYRKEEADARLQKAQAQLAPLKDYEDKATASLRSALKVLGKRILSENGLVSNLSREEQTILYAHAAEGMSKIRHEGGSVSSAVLAKTRAEQLEKERKLAEQKEQWKNNPALRGARTAEEAAQMMDGLKGKNI